MSSVSRVRQNIAFSRKTVSSVRKLYSGSACTRDESKAWYYRGRIVGKMGCAGSAEPKIEEASKASEHHNGELTEPAPARGPSGVSSTSNTTADGNGKSGSRVFDGENADEGEEEDEE